MSGTRVVVYAGPTISAADVHALLPEAEVRPPAGRGDLLADRWQPGDVVVVIDGYFRERRSVGHKEILQVLTEGAEVIGAASMGALRAAELGPCGMRGTGAVHEMYASGEIDGDDEVGVLHGPAEMGYPAQTVALVNLRYGCEEGAETDLVPMAAGRRIVAAAAALPFTHRGWKDIERALEERDHDALRTLEEMIGSGVWDLKRLDAVSALREIADRGTVPAAPVTADVPFTGISRAQSLVRRTRREYAPAAGCRTSTCWTRPGCSTTATRHCTRACRTPCWRSCPAPGARPSRSTRRPNWGSTPAHRCRTPSPAGSRKGNWRSSPERTGSGSSW